MSEKQGSTEDKTLEGPPTHENDMLAGKDANDN